MKDVGMTEEIADMAAVGVEDASLVVGRRA